MQEEATFIDAKVEASLLLLQKHTECHLHIFGMENMPLTTLYLMNVNVAMFVY